MKKALLIFVCLIPLITYSQNKQIIYLKNGEVLKGTIVNTEDSVITVNSRSNARSNTETMYTVKKYYIDSINNLSSSDVEQTDGELTYIETPGDELIKASNHYVTGFVFQVLGIGTSYLGTLAYKDQPNATTDDIKKNKNLRTGFVAAGSVMALIGIILEVEGIGHIAKAGIMMNLQAGPDGIGIIKKF